MKNIIIILMLIGTVKIVEAGEIDACSVLNSQAEVSEKLEVEIQGAASTLFKVGTVGANAIVSVDKEVKNIFSNHADANKTIIKSKLIYFYCSVIQSSDELSDAQKLNEIRKLYRDFDTLSPLDDSIMKVESLGFIFSLKECFQLGDNISCSLSVMNKNEIAEVILNHNSYLIDSDSELYYVKEIDFGTTTGIRFPSKKLIPGISVPIRMAFKGVVSQGSIIPLIKIMIKDSSTNKRDEMNFKNITLKN